MCGQSIEAGKALAVGLVIAEMMTNALKHAHPTGIPVIVNVSCCRTDDGSICIEVLDDGIGFPEGFDESKDGGLGVRLMRSLAEQIDAELHFTNDGAGSSYRLTVQAPSMARDLSSGLQWHQKIVTTKSKAGNLWIKVEPRSSFQRIDEPLQTFACSGSSSTF